MTEDQRQRRMQKLQEELDWWTDEYEEGEDEVCQRMICIIEDMLTVLKAQP